MSKNLKITLGSIYLVFLIIFLYFLFSKFDISRINDFSYYKTIQANIDEIIGSNLTLNLILYFIFSFMWVVLLGFGSPILLLSGILFGKYIGTFISTFSISLGALCLYIVANFFFSDLVHLIFKDKFSKYIKRFQKNEFYYFFAFRFIGGLGTPFFLQNVLPVIFKMKNKNPFPSINNLESGEKVDGRIDSFIFSSINFFNLRIPIIIIIIIIHNVCVCVCV